MSKWIARIIRISLGLLMVYMVYHETGPWTAGFCILVLAGFEGQDLVTESQAQLNTTIRDAFAMIEKKFNG